jgi:16S rRNA (cytosine967-C5)-methyltransferase
MKAPRMALPPDRRAAFDLLTAVLDRGRSLEEALDALPALAPRDRAAAHRLAATVLRRLGSLDALLDACLTRAPPAPARHVLRLGAAQLLLLATPAHAAVDTSVALARAVRLAGFAGLVNAVLRRLSAEGTALLAELDPPRLDTPAWLWAELSAAFGAAARDIALAHQAEAPLDLTPAPGAAVPPDAMVLPTGSWRLPAGTRVPDLPGYAEGGFWVQDAAAALPARLLAPRPGERVADLCAAPGGKTAQLAAAGALVWAVDRDAARMARLRENLSRLRLPADTVVADATSWAADAPFDAVLLDAPCTATGTIRRHPDVARLKRPRDADALSPLQDALLDTASRLLRPGGRMVFAVCSLLPQEGPARVAAATGRLGLRADPFTPEELAALPEARTPEGFLRTHPGLWPERGGMDGFFAARLVRP